MTLLLLSLPLLVSPAGAQKLAFTDVSAQSGLWDVPTGWGVTAVDIDGDGHTDLVMANNGSENALFFNEGKLRFRGRPLIGGAPGTEALVPADVDGDGKLDLLACAWGGPLTLFRGLGAGRFADVTKKSGLAIIPDGRCGSASFGDIDGDGDPDLFVPDGRKGDHLYRNDAGVLVDVTAAAGLANVPAGEGALMADLDDDGRLDIYVARWSDASALYRFAEGGVYEDLSALTDVFKPAGQVGCCALDANGDGNLDLLLVRGRFSEATYNCLLINDGKGGFTDRTPPEWTLLTRHTQTACVGDVDNDGDLDVFFSAADGCTLWLSDGQGHFSRAFEDAPWEKIPGAGAILCDLDDDGDLDLLVRARPTKELDVSGEFLFRNDLNNGNWLKVQPVSQSGSRFCLGVQVRVYDAGFLGDRQHLVARRDVISGCGWGCYLPFHAHFGLDGAKQYDVEARFPGGTRGVARGVRAGQTIEAKAGQA